MKIPANLQSTKQSVDCVIAQRFSISSIGFVDDIFVSITLWDLIISKWRRHKHLLTKSQHKTEIKPITVFVNFYNCV